MSYRQWLLGLGVLVLSAMLLLGFKLGQVPAGMTWDEAAIGYNGYAVVTTRRDEWLQKIPISFRSFGDYKAPLAIYLDGVVVWLLGSELWVVRLPFAVAGVGSVIAMVAVADEVLRQTVTPSKLRRPLSLLAGVVLLTTPWFLHFARAGFESGLALGFLLWGTWGVLRLDRELVYAEPRRGWLAVAALSSVMGWIGALYAYHSAKVVVPVLALAAGVWFWRTWRKHWQLTVVLAVVAVVSAMPLVKDVLMGEGTQRFEQTSLLTKGFTTEEIVAKLGHHLLLHISPSFWVGGATDTLRHGDGRWGVLLLTTAVLAVVGVIAAVKLWPQRTARSSTLFILSWLGAGLVPAIIGEDVPHSNRALLGLPAVVLLVIYGVKYVYEWLLTHRWQQRGWVIQGRKVKFLPAVIGVLLTVHALLFTNYQRDYYTVFAKASVDDYRSGVLEAAQRVVVLEKSANPPLDKILFTSDYGQPYIYILFARRTSPIWYQGGSLSHYEFNEKINIGDLSRVNTLVVASAEDEVPVTEADEVIYDAAGQPKFYIYAAHP